MPKRVTSQLRKNNSPAYISRAAVVTLLLLGSQLSIAAQTPYSGSPITVPGTWEAENFDLGGEGVAYHDNVLGNAGGQYRPSEDVDIIVSSDPQGGGYLVNNFETGEWLEYTINVATAGFYNVEIRASNNNWSPPPAFRVEIEGRGDVTGTVTVPNTGGWTLFQWVARNGVYLNAGQQVLRVVSVQQYFNLNSIRITAAPNPSPYFGTPIAVPGTCEAENFDLGGEAVAYHDNVVGNAGGQYRPSEDVDIIVSSDPQGGGYVVNNFETGEWMIYTIQAASSGVYDIAVRVSNDNWSPSPAFHVEIDGVNVTGSVVVPSTGAWNAFTWIIRSGITLSAGQHVLKIVSDQQYFDLNQIRLTATPPSPANLLFRSGYENATAVGAPTACWGTGCWQELTGRDAATGFEWPPNIWGGNVGAFQLLADAPVDAGTISNYFVNQIQSGTGRNGTQSLYSEVKRSGCCGTNPQGGVTQDPYILLPPAEPSGTAGDMYVSYWLKFQPDLVQKMTPQTWRVFFEWKTAGDYRVSANVVTWDNVVPYWDVRGDNVGDGGLPWQTFWQLTNDNVTVPVNEWFKFEVFWHRSGNFNDNSGRVWMAVNGQVIADASNVTLPDKNTSMMGINHAPINRIMVNQVYSGSAYPIYQWVDDLQIWRGFPAATAGDPWYDPPYAPH